MQPLTPLKNWRGESLVCEVAWMKPVNVGMGGQNHSDIVLLVFASSLLGAEFLRLCTCGRNILIVLPINQPPLHEMAALL